MTNPHYQYHQHIVEQTVDDPPVANAQPISGISFQRFDALPILFVDLARITPTPTRPLEGAGVRFQALPLDGGGFGRG